MADDSFATPMAKLPPPAMVMNSDRGPLDEKSMNYNDILNKMNESPGSNQYQQQQQQQMQQHLPLPPPPPPPPQDYNQQPTMEYYNTPPQQQQQQHYPMEYMEPPSSSSPPSSKLSFDTLKNKNVWLFAIIMFLSLSYGLPKLRQMFPSLINPATGGLSMPSIATASVFSGILFSITSSFI